MTTGRRTLRRIGVAVAAIVPLTIAQHSGDAGAYCVTVNQGAWAWPSDSSYGRENVYDASTRCNDDGDYYGLYKRGYPNTNNVRVAYYRNGVWNYTPYTTNDANTFYGYNDDNHYSPTKMCRSGCFATQYNNDQF
jgi:hypothetical protein